VNDLPKEKPYSVIQSTRERFKSEINSPEKFPTYRGLYKHKLPDGSMSESYIDVLPTFKGKDFASLIDEEVQRREQRATLSEKPFERIVIVDIGYGMGQFLLDCKERWGDKVSLIGFGTDVYAKRGFHDADNDIVPTYDVLINLGVNLVEGNVIDIEKRLENNSADFVVASNALIYVLYPRWELLKKIYRVLKQNGIALLDSGPYPEGGAELEKYLEENGYLFEFTAIGTAFKKTNPDVNILAWTDISTPFRNVIVGK